MPSDWLIWQLADSAFPAGGFAHSAGLEATWKHGLLPDALHLTSFLRTALTQAARFSVPFAMAVCRDPETFDATDHHVESFLTNHVANRASRAQGQGLLAAAARAFDHDLLQTLSAKVRRREAIAHGAPVWGAVGAAMSIAPDRVASLMLFTTLRGMISAAVRLGICGPLQGQSIQHELAADAGQLTREACATPIEEAAQTAPLLDLLQGTQDRLYSRLFIS